MQGPWVGSLVEELDPTCCQLRVPVPQLKIPCAKLRPGTAKYVTIFKKSPEVRHMKTYIKWMEEWQMTKKGKTTRGKCPQEAS